MKLHKTGKMVRILSMVLVVAMLLSAMMVQAFAEVSSRSEIINGYTASSYVTVNSSFRAYGETTYDVSAIVEMSLSGYYARTDGLQEPISGEGGANHYQVTVYANTRPSAAYTSCRVVGNGRVYGQPVGEVVYSR